MRRWNLRAASLQCQAHAEDAVPTIRYDRSSRPADPKGARTDAAPELEGHDTMGQFLKLKTADGFELDAYRA